MFRSKGALLAAALGCTVANATAIEPPPAPPAPPPAPPEGVVVPAADCPPTELSKPSPSYPPSQLRAGREGGVLLKVTVDRCGIVQAATVFRSSRVPAFDSAAIEATSRARISGQRASLMPDGTLAAILPIEFVIDGAGRGNWHDAKAVRASWCATRVATPALSGDTLPGFVADPQPMTGSIDAVLGGIENDATYLPRPNTTDVYVINDLHRHETYRLFFGAWKFAPALLRIRRVHDGQHAYLVSSTLCESKTADGCALFDEFVREVPKPQTVQRAPERPAPRPGGGERDAPGQEDDVCR